MSFFARGLHGSDPSFTPLFRLLDEFDNYSRESQGNNNGRARHRGRQHFQPKFDVCETDNAFELHGELPGIERDNVNIEFTDPQTLVIRGVTERTFTAGTPPAGLVEGSKQHAGAISEKGEETAAAAPPQDSGSGVEEISRQEKPKAAADKYWLQERSVGEFARTFSFPNRVDQDAVSASLNNGILTVIVPKAKKHEARRVAIH